MAFEMALKKGKPMIMSYEDFNHASVMLTACRLKFDNPRQACSTIIEGAYMSDVHVDFFNSKHGIAVIKGQEAKSVDYPVYNARSGDLYDVFLRVVEYPDCTVTVRLVRPSASGSNKD